MELHLPRQAIRSLKTISQDFNQTVSDVGLLSTLEKSIAVDATFGKENLELRLGWCLWDGSGHHFERSDTFIRCSERHKSSIFSRLRRYQPTSATLSDRLETDARYRHLCEAENDAIT